MSNELPRDNVVFEAGYFAAAKGRDRVLIIREDGAKAPTDWGGNIYFSGGKGRYSANQVSHP